MVIFCLIHMLKLVLALVYIDWQMLLLLIKFVMVLYMHHVYWLCSHVIKILHAVIAQFIKSCQCALVLVFNLGFLVLDLRWILNFLSNGWAHQAHFLDYS